MDGDMTATQALNVVKPVVKIADGSKVVVKSLIGRSFELTLFPTIKADIAGRRPVLASELRVVITFGRLKTWRREASRM